VCQISLVRIRRKLGLARKKYVKKASRRTSHVRVRGRLERTEPTADDKRRPAKSTEALLQACRPHHESADAVQGKPKNECRAIAISAKDPVSVPQRCEWVGSKVSSLETG
jgi:hypothetical protein